MEAPHRALGFLLFLLSVAGASLIRLTVADGGASLSRCSFPPGFLFGTASAAYQYEGAVAEGGRGPSIWDTYTQQHPEKIADGSSGSVAVDFYHRYKEDIATMKDMGMDAFRFSISWSRILPTGSLSGGINYEGIAYYNNVINELLSKGLQPFVTLFHWDSPQGLEDQYGGFLSPNIVEDYINYVDICFREFGDRVKHWITFNEPWSVALAGYQVGFLAPGRCTSTPGRTCDGGNSKTEPYIVAHHILLAHGAAVKLYRDKYQGSQQGSMGITLNSHWFLPFEDTQADRDAVQRSLDFMFGWYMDPLTRGDYPAIMRERVGDRLPSFTEQESQMIKGAFDFIGLNYYTTNYAVALPMTATKDTAVNLTGSYNGKTIGPHDAIGWLYVYPDGFREILRYTRDKYNNPVIYVTENGYDDFNNASLPLAEALKDDARTSYYQQHLEKLWESISLDGVDVRGYFSWSLLDNFEWASGYTSRFGLHFVDYKDGLKRYPKNSARWFQKLLKGV